MRDHLGDRGIKNRDAKAAPMTPFETGDLMLESSVQSICISRQG
jgi:hypothetical protein